MLTVTLIFLSLPLLDMTTAMHLPESEPRGNPSKRPTTQHSSSSSVYMPAASSQHNYANPPPTVSGNSNIMGQQRAVHSRPSDLYMAIQQRDPSHHLIEAVEQQWPSDALRAHISNRKSPQLIPEPMEQQRPSDALRAHISNRKSPQLIPEPMEQQRPSTLHTPSSDSSRMRQIHANASSSQLRRGNQEAVPEKAPSVLIQSQLNGGHIQRKLSDSSTLLSQRAILNRSSTLASSSSAHLPSYRDNSRHYLGLPKKSTYEPSVKECSPYQRKATNVGNAVEKGVGAVMGVACAIPIGLAYGFTGSGKGYAAGWELGGLVGLAAGEVVKQVGTGFNPATSTQLRHYRDRKAREEKQKAREERDAAEED